MKRIERGLVAVLAVGTATFIVVSALSVGHSQTLPAPVVDRVGFPAGYKDTYKLFYVFDNYQNRQIRAVYGNSIAASVDPAQPFNFPYGSIVLFESYTVHEDPSGEPLLDKNGRFVPTRSPRYSSCGRSVASAWTTKSSATGNGNLWRTDQTARTRLRLRAREAVPSAT